MPDRYFNPFQSVDISVPVEFHDDLVRYSQREGRAIIDNSPFPRMVDMWFLAVCVGARKGLTPADVRSIQTRKIIDGTIFSSDPWRIYTLMLIAIAHTGGVEIVAEPRKMIDLANGLAVSGLAHVLDMLKDGGSEPIWNLSEAVESLMPKRAKER
jgi:hypothetical protein